MTWNELVKIAEGVGDFSRVVWPRWEMREYQARVAGHVARSVLAGAGLQFAVVFARQSGKDEMLAQLTAYLMNRHRLAGGSILTVNPTYRPQGLIARRRLLDRLGSNIMTGPATSDGHLLRLGRASCGFLSANPVAQARGETATLMLACNEAQEVQSARWDAVFDPMGASASATQVFSGTVWTSSTLLARQMAYLGELERKDGVKRVFKVGWEEVALYVPRYGDQVCARIAQFGRDHPFIRTEYFLEELDAGGGPVRSRPPRPDARPPPAPPLGHTRQGVCAAG